MTVQREVGLRIKRLGADERHAFLVETSRNFAFGAGDERGGEREHLFAFHKLDCRLRAVLSPLRRLGKAQFDLALIDASSPVDFRHECGQGRAHGKTHLRKQPRRSDDDPDANPIRRQPGIRFPTDDHQVGDQIGKIPVGHAVSRHGVVERPAGRVEPHRDRAFEQRRIVGRAFSTASARSIHTVWSVRPSGYSTARCPLPVCRGRPAGGS